MQIAEDAIIHISAGLDEFNHNPLPSKITNDISVNLALHGPDGTDYDRSWLSSLIKNIIEEIEQSITMTYIRLEKPARFFGKMHFRKSCPEVKDMNVKNDYQSQRRATPSEIASLVQILNIIKIKDFVYNVRNCCMSVDRACRQLELAVERFSR
jgi:hypothetical protein